MQPRNWNVFTKAIGIISKEAYWNLEGLVFEERGKPEHTYDTHDAGSEN